MSNELNNIVSRTTNGVYEGVAIGGDRYPGTNFMDHIMRYQKDPEVRILTSQYGNWQLVILYGTKNIDSVFLYSDKNARSARRSWWHRRIRCMHRYEGWSYHETISSLVYRNMR